MIDYIINNEELILTLALLAIPSLPVSISAFLSTQISSKRASNIGTFIMKIIDIIGQNTGKAKNDPKIQK